jgi:hypothetical protein
VLGSCDGVKLRVLFRRRCNVHAHVLVSLVTELPVLLLWVWTSTLVVYSFASFCLSISLCSFLLTNVVSCSEFPPRWTCGLRASFSTRYVLDVSAVSRVQSRIVCCLSLSVVNSSATDAQYSVLTCLTRSCYTRRCCTAAGPTERDTPRSACGTTASSPTRARWSSLPCPRYATTVGLLSAF